MSNSYDHGYALLIAVNDSELASAKLDETLKDIEALHGVLAHPQRCAYLPKNIKTITSKDSTRAGIMDGLEWLRGKLAEDKSGQATAVIYYSGHGHLQDGRYYLVPFDLKVADPVKKTLRSTSLISAEDFASDIASLQPKRLLVMLDCCHASGMSVKDLASSPDPVGISVAAIPAKLFAREAISADGAGKGINALSEGYGRAVISSSQANERSYLRKDRAMSIFTYHIIEALTGHAQPQIGATEVLVSDLVSYVTRHVPNSAQADWKVEQHPDSQINGNFPIALLLGGKGIGAGGIPPSPLDIPKAHPSQSANTRDVINLQGSQGSILNSTGPISQHFGNVVNNTGSGAVATNGVDVLKAVGNSVPATT